MKKTTMLGALSCVVSVLLLVPNVATAEKETPQPLYVSVDCMKSTSGDYVSVEKEIWQPMHQKLVDQGKRNSWALYRVEYGDRSRCDFYTVTTYRGVGQLNVDPAYDELFEAVHGKMKLKAAMARTFASRENVASELWIAVDSTEIGRHRFAVVNMMYAEDPDIYETMESTIFKPGHQALIDSGYRTGWGVFALVAPAAKSVRHNYSTMDFVNQIGPVPMAEFLLSANPDRDLEAMHDMLELREHISSETWALVTATE